IEHVTNGVHVPSWESPSADTLWSTSCGKKRWLEDTATLEAHIQTVPASAIWKMRTEARQKLVQFARKRLSLQKAVAGESLETIKWASKLLNPNILTLGFARRFATYKRPNLLLHDPERFIALLTHPKFPVQLLIAGKAHPADQQGQALIQQWSNFIKQHHLESHIAFLADYDMFLAEQLVQGVDLWVNNPLRPWEACGTSGMKILANGGLNLSVLDGWWAEAYSPEVGWAIPHSEDTGQVDKEKREAEDADALYTLLENEVVPLYYTRNQEDIPEGWVTKIRASMAKLTPYYSANRAVREYTEKYYLPAAELYFTRTNTCRIKNCQEDFAKYWNELEFKKIDVQTQADLHYFTVDLALRQIDPKTIKVELFATEANGNPSIHVMNEVQKVDDHDHVYRYTTKVPATYPSNYYTARVRPNVSFSEATPLELPYILWQH
ncbi:MAG: alpha-glucan family phosphorylase, partial [Parachlamydiaceae bacterium]